MAIKLSITDKDGKTSDVTGLVSSITWSGDYQQCARTLEFSLLSSPTDTNIPTVPCNLGYGVVLADDEKTFFNGYIFSRQKDTESSTIEITCYDRGIYLKRNEAVYKFTNMTAEAITKRICSDFDIPVGSVAETGVKISRNFVGLSLYKIIQTAYTLASEKTKEKYQIRFEGEKLSVIQMQAGDSTLVIEGKSNLMSSSTTESVENMVNQVVIYNNNDRKVATRSDEEAIGDYGLMQSYLKQSDSKDCSDEAEKMLSDYGVSQKITIENLGDISCVTGNAVLVHENYTGVTGLFYISSDTHTWKNGLYLNKLVVDFEKLMDEQTAGEAIG